MTPKGSRPVRRGAVGKVPQSNSLAAYSTARCVLRGLGEGDLAWLPGGRKPVIVFVWHLFVHGSALCL